MLAFTDLGERDIELKRPNPEGSIVCVSAAVFKPTKYKQFCREWERMLFRWNATAFHATDFYGGAEEFERNTPARKALLSEDSKRIPTMIGKSVEKVTLIAFKPREFIQKAPPMLLERFGKNIHSIVMQVILFELGWWRLGKCPSQKFSYFMESGDEGEGQIVEAVRIMSLDHPATKVIGVQSFTPTEKGNARGLEAADFWAWHWNKYYVDKILRGSHKPRKDFEAAVRATKNGVSRILLSEEKLDYFFTRLSQDGGTVS